MFVILQLTRWWLIIWLRKSFFLEGPQIPTVCYAMICGKTERMQILSSIMCGAERYLTAVVVYHCNTIIKKHTKLVIWLNIFIITHDTLQVYHEFTGPFSNLLSWQSRSVHRAKLWHLCWFRETRRRQGRICEQIKDMGGIPDRQQRIVVILRPADVQCISLQCQPQGKGYHYVRHVSSGIILLISNVEDIAACNGCVRRLRADSVPGISTHLSIQEVKYQ